MRNSRLVLLFFLCVAYDVQGVNVCDKITSEHIYRTEPFDGIIYKFSTTGANIIFLPKGSSADILYNTATKELSVTKKIYMSTKVALFACMDDGPHPFTLTIHIMKPGANWMSGDHRKSSIHIEIPEGRGAVSSIFPRPQDPKLWCKNNKSMQKTKVKFDILPGLHSDNFRILPPGEKNTLAMRLSSPFDYQKTQQAKVQVRCIITDEKGKSLDFADLVINIRITNLYNLQFKDGKNPVDKVRIFESVKRLTPIKTISVYYPPGKRRNLTFTVLTHPEVFQFRNCDQIKMSCELVLNRYLDYENLAHQFWQVKYRVYDGLTFEIEGDLRIELLQANIKSLKFTEKMYVFNNISASSLYIGQVKAADKYNPGDITYSIKEDTAKEYITINETTGKLYFKVPSRHLKLELHHLTVKARSAKEHATAYATIELKTADSVRASAPKKFETIACAAAPSVILMAKLLLL